MAVIRLQDGWVDLDACAVRRGGDSVGLTAIEHRLLSYLAGRLGVVVSRDQLLVEVWEYRPGVRTRTIDNTVRRLRKKIERDPAEPAHLHVMYGQGLKLEAVLEPGQRTDGADLPLGGRLVGRAEELGAVEEALRSSARVVEVRGPAGAGKSRLMAELLRRPDRLGVGLEGAIDVHEVDRRVGAALGVMPAAEGPIRFALRERGVSALLLDGCEGAVEALSARIPGWLSEAPELRVVVATRAALSLDGAVTVPLGPLPMEDAIALFCDRARQRSPTFRAQGVEDELRQLLEGLDRLPLAIELAASRLPTVGVPQLVQLLDRRLDLLEGEHRGMRAMLDQSLALLSAAQREALAQLSVFAAPFTLADAERILGTSRAVERVLSLVERSLLRALPPEGDGSLRYALYEVVREHALERLPPQPDACRRHAVWFARWGEPERRALLRRVLAERARARAAIPELRTVVERMREEAPELACRAALALLDEYTTFGPLDAAVALLRSLEGVRCSDSLQGEILICACDVDLFHGGGRCRALASRGLALAVTPELRFRLQLMRARAAHLDGHPEAVERDLERCARDLQQLGLLERGLFHFSCGDLLSRDDRIEEARRSMRQATEAFRQIGDPVWEAAAWGVLGSIARGQGEYAEGAESYRRSAELLAGAGWSTRNEAVTRMHWAVLERQRGDLDAASLLLAEAERLHRQVGNASGLEVVSIERGLILVQQGRWEGASEVLEGRLRVEGSHSSYNATWLLSAVALVRYRLGSVDGARRALDVAIELAKHNRLSYAEGCHQGLWALLEGEAGDREGGRACLARGEAILKGLGARTVLARHHAMAALFEARFGDPAAAAAALAEARALREALGLRDGSEAAGWIREAEAHLPSARAAASG